VYDPRRLGGSLAALAALAIALAAGGVFLSPVVAGHPRWLPDADSLCDVRDFKANLARVGGVVREARDRVDTPREGRLGLLIGSSSLEWGVDAARMPAMEDSRPMRWLSVSAMGSTIEDNARMADLALRAGLRPEVVVLCLGPASLASRINVLDDPVVPDLAALREDVAARHAMLAKEDVESFLLIPLNRAFPNRSRIGRWTRITLFDARLGLFAALGFNLDALGPPMRDPWSATPWWAGGDHAPESLSDKQFVGLRQGRVFDPESYSTDSQNDRDLVRLVRTLRDAGAEVVIVLTPESERRRVAAPPEFLATLREVLRQGFGPDAPPLLDFRDAMPADAFFDLSHLNPRGRAAFTDRLGRALRELPRRPAQSRGP
jgi:hypothetical protein